MKIEVQSSKRRRGEFLMFWSSYLTMIQKFHLVVYNMTRTQNFTPVLCRSIIIVL